MPVPKVTEAMVEARAWAWMAYCPETGGRLFEHSEAQARDRGHTAYAPREFHVVPLGALTAALSLMPEREGIGHEFDLETFERATDLMAMWLARFRAGDPGSDEQPNENDKLTAGHLAGALAANKLLATPAHDIAKRERERTIEECAKRLEISASISSNAYDQATLRMAAGLLRSLSPEPANPPQSQKEGE